jgi:hypothetical protein
VVTRARPAQICVLRRRTLIGAAFSFDADIGAVQLSGGSLERNAARWKENSRPLNEKRVPL